MDELNRETGESPVRSRHCMGELQSRTTESQRLGKETVGVEPKPGDLPFSKHTF